MPKNIIKAYFQAVGTGEARYLLAVGRKANSGVQPVLEPVGDNDDFRFTANESGQPSADVVTPFCIHAEIKGEPRSVTVLVDGKPIQVQCYGIKGAPPGGNTAGDWVEI